MTTTEKRQYRDEGTALADLIADMVFNAKLTGVSLAQMLGKSEATISCILAPDHDAQFSIKDLPALLRILDGKAILKVICGWTHQYPADLPNGATRQTNAMFAVGNVLAVIGRAIQDGELSIQDTQVIKNALIDAIGTLDGYMSNRAGQL